MATNHGERPVNVVRCRHGFVSCSWCGCPGGYSLVELLRWNIDQKEYVT